MKEGRKEGTKEGVKLLTAPSHTLFTNPESLCKDTRIVDATLADVVLNWHKIFLIYFSIVTANCLQTHRCKVLESVLN